MDSAWALPGCNHDHQDDMKQFPARNLHLAPKLWIQQKLTVSEPELNGLKHTLAVWCLDDMFLGPSHTEPHEV